MPKKCNKITSYYKVTFMKHVSDAIRSSATFYGSYGEAGNCLTLHRSRNLIRTEFLSAAAGAVAAYPYAVELFDGGGDEVGVGGEDACFKIAAVFAFHADARPCQVGRADVGTFQIHDDELEMHARAEHAFQGGCQNRKTVKIFPKGGAGFLGVNEPHIHPAFQQLRPHPQQGRGFPAPLPNVDVLNIRRSHPKLPLHLLHAGKDLLVMRFVSDVLGEEHNVQACYPIEMLAKKYQL